MPHNFTIIPHSSCLSFFFIRYYNWKLGIVSFLSCIFFYVRIYLKRGIWNKNDSVFICMDAFQKYWNFTGFCHYSTDSLVLNIYLSKFLSYHLTSWTGSSFAVHYIGQWNHEHKLQYSRNHNINIFWQIQHRILS